MPEARKTRTWMIAGIVVSGILGLALAAFLVKTAIVASGITRGPDAMFGDHEGRPPAAT